MDPYAIMFDPDRCIGCQTCITSCKLTHRLGPGQFRNDIVFTYSEASQRLGFFYQLCQHCERPACVRSCGTWPRAIEKRGTDGVVVIHREYCVGCMNCVEACPFGMMSFEPLENKADKCDLCVGLIDRIKEPACVSHCPGYALSFGTKEMLIEQAQKDGRGILNFDHPGQNPSIIYLKPLRFSYNAGKNEIVPFPRLKQKWFSILKSEAKSILMKNLAPHVRVEEFPFHPKISPFETDRVERAGCTMCFNSCSLLFYIKDGKVIHITGNPNDTSTKGKLCSKGLNNLITYNNRYRLTRALKRIGERGEGNYVEIDYDEALEEFAEKLKRVRETYDPESLAIYTTTRSSYLQQRGLAPIFARAFGTPNFAGSAPLCDTAMDQAFTLFQGGRSGNIYSEDDLGIATFHLILGDNMAETRIVNFGLINHCRLKNRAKLVVVDPRMGNTAAKADKWLPIRPGTDMALALAMAYHIIKKNLVNKEFVEKWVEGYDKVKQFILEKQYTPEWAQPITDIPAEEIKQLAEEYASAERSVIFASRGIAQHSNGVQTIRALMILPAVTGHWGKKGAGIQMSTSGKMLGISGQESPEGIRRPGISLNPVGWIEAICTGKPYPIKAMIWAGNPCGLWPGLYRLKDGLKNLEVIAHLDIWRNDTSYASDYVFPSAHGVECGEINRSTEDRKAMWIPKLIDPPGDARPQTYFWVELAKRFGMGHILKEEYKDTARFFESEMRASPLAKGVTIKRMMEAPKGFVRMPLLADDSEEIDTMYLECSVYPGDGKGRRIPTPSGKLELWTEAMEKKFNEIGLSALPEFYSERDQLIDLPHLHYLQHDSEERTPSPFWNYACYTSPVKIVERQAERHKEYDTELISGDPPAPHFHSWLHHIWQAWEMRRDLFVHMHPEKAKAIGVSTGDRVIIENQRGAIEAVAWVHPGIRLNAVYIPQGWGEKQPFSQWKSVNWLMPYDQRCPISDQANVKITLCRVRKA